MSYIGEDAIPKDSHLPGGGTFYLNAEATSQLAWQHSPLRRAIDDVVNASRKHQGYRVGANRATARIVVAAEALREVREQIDLGKRDGLGYLR